MLFLSLGTSGAWAACRMHADGHLAGCQIARKPTRSEGPSFRIAGLDLGRVPLSLTRENF
ncbi:MAG: hypothetical protein GX892_03155 [Thermoanaerobacteraceae bacterium]|nr:hypothetical protein [Thermoanaerobacteraceae bacterium]